jgi:hypothetical protein
MIYNKANLIKPYTIRFGEINMKRKILLISLILLTFTVFWGLSHTLSFTLYEPAIIMEARAEEMDSRLDGSQEGSGWYAQMQEDPNEEENEYFNPYPEAEEEDFFKNMPYDVNSEAENFQGDEEAEGGTGEDSTEDPESRR